MPYFTALIAHYVQLNVAQENNRLRIPKYKKDTPFNRAIHIQDYSFFSIQQDGHRSPLQSREGVKARHIGPTAGACTVPPTYGQILAVRCHSAKRRNALAALSQ